MKSQIQRGSTTKHATVNHFNYRISTTHTPDKVEDPSEDMNSSHALILEPIGILTPIV